MRIESLENDANVKAAVLFLIADIAEYAAYPVCCAWSIFGIDD